MALMRYFICSLLLFFSFALGAQQANPYRLGNIHVKFKESVASTLSINFDQVTSNVPELNQTLKTVQARSIKRVFRESGKYEMAHHKFGLHLWYEIKFDERVSLDEALGRFGALPIFDKVEATRPYSLIEPKEVKVVSSGARLNQLNDPPSDPRFAQQWHYQNTGQTGGMAGADVSLPAAWSIETGNPNVIVAVIDGGIDYQHPDLTASMWINADEIANNNLDDDKNGYVDDIYGYGFGDGTGTIYPHFHGTHVGGTIAAVTNNNIGVSGIAGGSGTGNGVRLMSLAGFGNVGVGGFENAMVYAADNGAVISQNSWGGGGSAIEAGIDYFIARAGYDNTDENFDDNIQIGPMAGGIVIFAAGNSSSSNPNAGYPGSYEPVMAVASTDHNDQRSYFSNYGDWIEIAAPGSDVLSTYPVSMGGYALLSGTSMACPHVSGVAALIVSKFGGDNLVPSMVWDRLQFSADNIDQQNPNYIGMLGSGRLNASQALESDDDIPPATITNLSANEPLLTSVELTWTAPGSSEMEGTASIYDIRYSENLITSANFDQATRFPRTARPLPSGSTETAEVTGLGHSTTYYFAVKARDYFGNEATISNVISATTLLPPVIQVTPSSLSPNLFSGETRTDTLLITNNGLSSLQFDVTMEVFTQSSNSISRQNGGFSISDAGDYLKTPRPLEDRYKKSNIFVSNGLSLPPYDGNQPQRPHSVGKVFMLNVGNNTIVEVDPDDGSIIHSINAPEQLSGGPDGLAYDGQYLYLVNSFGSNLIYKINANSGQVIGTISMAGVGSIDALAHSGEYLYALDYGTSRILEIDFEAGNIERVINPGIYLWGGLSFGGSRGTIFVTNSGQGIYELDLETGSTVNYFSVPQIVYGLGYSNALNILYAADVSSGVLRGYNPDSGEQVSILSLGSTSALASDEADGGRWISVGDYTTEIEPGQSVKVPVTFDATDLFGGLYEAAITIESNDPVTPAVEVPISLTVIGAPNILLNPVVLDFGDAYEGAIKEKSLVIHNTGTDALSIMQMLSNSSSFQTVFTPFTIPPRDSVTVMVEFHAGNLGNYTGELAITSNDPNESLLIVPLSGSVVLAPRITLNPEEFKDTLVIGAQRTRVLTITNDGFSTLNWSIERSDISDSDLPSVLGNLNTNYTSISNLIPNRFNFSEGETGSSISDGGNDMYDGGNYLSTNLGGYINYSNRSITTSPYLGNGSQYFTAKYPGLFVLVANVQALSQFSISGNAGADGGGSVDGTILTSTRGGRSFKGFVKRTYNAWDPSINHLVIVENVGSPSHSFPNNSDNDEHIIQSLSSVTRIYYLLYGGANGDYITNAQTQAIMDAFLDAIGEGGSWISLGSNTSGSLEPSQTASVNINLNATGLELGDYESLLAVSSNDPVNPLIDVPVALHIIGTPNLTLDSASLHFGLAYQGAQKHKLLTLHNNGTDVLNLNSIAFDNGAFTSNFNTPKALAPGDSCQMDITFTAGPIGVYNGNLSISSNDHNDPVTIVPLYAQVVLSPIIGINPSSFTIALNSDQQTSRLLTISNTGAGNLSWSATTEGSSGSNLAVLLPALNAGYTSVTNQIPNRYNFYGGESGNQIDDGGGDMYDGGNYLRTNLGGYINYSNKAISSSTLLGTSGSYFTAKYDGLFVFAADVSISNFEIQGNLGADGSGQVSGTVLTLTKGSRTFKGFVKRVYNAGDPSVNHLIIVENQGTPGHSYTSSTDNDNHIVTGLNNVNRIYYLLFAGNNGAFIDDAAFQNIMNAFLTISEGGSSWLTISPTSGNVSPGGTQQVTTTFNANRLNTGVYQTQIKVFSNDPVDSELAVPATLTVTGVPDIDLPVTSIDFGSLYVGTNASVQLKIRNPGTDFLTINDIVSSNSRFTVSPSSFHIQPRSEANITVLFTATSAGNQTGTLTITSNDSDEPSVSVSLQGSAVLPPYMEVAPNPINVQIIKGERKGINIKIKNVGGATMNWQFYNWSQPISFDTQSGSISAGGEQNVKLTIDSWGMFVGSQSLYIYLYYNHPINGYYHVPVNVTVALNSSPTVSVAIPNQHVAKLEQLNINLAEHFADANGDVLKYQVSSTDPSKAAFFVLGSVLSINGVNLGSSQFTVSAEDQFEARVETQFTLYVDAVTGLEPETTVEVSPNPFTSEVKITYTLKEDIEIMLTIHDALGRELTQLTKGWIEPGEHTAIFDGTNQSSGLYFYKLVVNGNPVKIGRMIKD